MKKSAFFGLIAGLAAFNLIAGVCAADITDRATNKSFPSEVTFDFNGDSYTLEATGVSTRKKFFAKVYSVASYVQDANELNKRNAIDEILNDNKAKQLTSIWVRDVTGQKVRDGYQDSFDKVSGRGGNIQGAVKEYISFFGDVKNNDTHVIRWLPGGTVEVLINGQSKGTIKDNPEFAKALWSIWFGSKSVVNRNELVAEIR